MPVAAAIPKLARVKVLAVPVDVMPCKLALFAALYSIPKPLFIEATVVPTELKYPIKNR